MIRTFRELQKIGNFEERYNYLRLSGTVGKSTFGFDRYLNQALYSSYQWQQIRDKVIVRDGGRDLGMLGYEIYGSITVHHMNPIAVEDIELASDFVFDPEYMICVSHKTHMAIHYGDKSLLPELPIFRYPGDMSPWKRR